MKFFYYLCMYMGISIGITCIQVQVRNVLIGQGMTLMNALKHEGKALIAISNNNNTTNTSTMSRWEHSCLNSRWTTMKGRACRYTGEGLRGRTPSSERTLAPTPRIRTLSALTRHFARRRLGIGNTIALVAVMIHSFIVTTFNDDGRIDVGYQLSGAIFGIWIAIAAWTTFWNIEEKFNPDLEEKDEQLSTLDGLKIVFQNKVREREKVLHVNN